MSTIFSCRDAFFLYIVYVQSTMALLRIDLSSTAPVYRQIVDGLRVLLVNGDLKPGDQLPPVRRLALDLGVHFNTVAEAYRTLAEAGWLDIRKRTGATVIERALNKPATPAMHQAFERQMTEAIADGQSRGLERTWIAQELRRQADALERR